MYIYTAQNITGKTQSLKHTTDIKTHRKPDNNSSTIGTHDGGQSNGDFMAQRIRVNKFNTDLDSWKKRKVLSISCYGITSMFILH